MISRRMLIQVLGAAGISAVVKDLEFWPEFITEADDVRVYPDDDLFVTVRGYVDGPAALERFIVFPESDEKKLGYARQIRIVRPENDAVIMESMGSSRGHYNWESIHTLIALPQKRIELMVNPNGVETLMFYRPLELPS